MTEVSPINATAAGKKVWFSQKLSFVVTKFIYEWMKTAKCFGRETHGSRATANLISFNYKRKNKLSHRVQAR